VAKSGCPSQVGFHSRFHPSMIGLDEIVKGGELGPPMGYSVRDDQYWPTGQVVTGHSSWRSDRVLAGGGALLEHSIHAVDLLCWMFGPVSRVQAVSRRVFGFEVEDVAALTIEHESGVVGNLLTVFNGVRGREERRVEVFFESGAVEVTTDFIVGASEDSFLVQRPDVEAVRPDLAAMRDERFTEMGIARRDFLFYTYVADRSWIRSVRDGTGPSPDFEDARWAHRVVDAAYRSAESRSPAFL
jgi:predicted dehydrogenase